MVCAVTDLARDDPAWPKALDGVGSALDRSALGLVLTDENPSSPPFCTVIWA